MNSKIVRVINSVAPVRICDFGGWTDTRFCKKGQVLNFAVRPYVWVQIQQFNTLGDVKVVLEDFNDTFLYNPSSHEYGDSNQIVKAAISRVGLGGKKAIINLHSEMPAGAGTGTSAAVTVALLAALMKLKQSELPLIDLGFIASEAHRVEADDLGLECGVQDQISSAFGGINSIGIYNYPNWNTIDVSISELIENELNMRFKLFYLGTSHRSSDVHKKVIESLDKGNKMEVLEKLSDIPLEAAKVLQKGDFVKFGKLMTQNNELQRQLHSDLISSVADEIFSIASQHKACGWMVNGAGGDGGSVTVLCGPEADVNRSMVDEINKIKNVKNIQIELTKKGVKVWNSV